MTGCCWPEGTARSSLTSLEQARQYRIGAYKGDAIALTLEKQGLAPVIVLRDQDNARSCRPGKSTCGPRATPAGRFLARQVGISGFKTVLRFNQAELYLALNKDVPDEWWPSCRRRWIS
jgi:polar amino acid transport system substrate-binding protein